MDPAIEISLSYLAIGSVIGLLSQYSRINPNDRAPMPIWVFLWPVLLFIIGSYWLIQTLIVKQFIALCDKLDKLLPFLLKKELHRDQYGILYSMPSRLGEMKVVRVQDSTGVYWIPVHPDTVRAKQAVAWTYQMGEDSYNPERV